MAKWTYLKGKHGFEVFKDGTRIICDISCLSEENAKFITEACNNEKKIAKMQKIIENVGLSEALKESLKED